MNKRAALFGALLVAGLIVLAVTTIDLRQTWEALITADYRAFIPAAACFALGLFARAARWRVLVDDRLPLRRAFHISNIGYWFNSLLPMRAGDVARVLLASRGTPSVPVFTSLSTLVLERVIDLLFLFGMLGAALIALPVSTTIAAGGAALAIGSALGFGALFVFASRRDWAHRLLAFALRRFPMLRRWNMTAALDRFLDGLRVLTAWRPFVLTVIWSAIGWGFTAATGYILLYAFFGQSDWAVVLLFLVTSSLLSTAVAAVAYTPGAVGPFQAGIVVALSMAGFTEPAAAPLAFAIAMQVFNLVIYGVLGAIGLIEERVTPDELLRHVRGLVAQRADTRQPSA